MLIYQAEYWDGDRIQPGLYTLGMFSTQELAHDAGVTYLKDHATDWYTDEAHVAIIRFVLDMHALDDENLHEIVERIYADNRDGSLR